ncbi:MAG TPA: hypothetical protein ENN99_10720 [Chloroflexi bacterium]|nr:hypothetical protein [Chloroflexota bacterium]
MAEVYKAYHPGLDRYVAIKVLHSFLADEEGFLTRFQREAKIVAAFRHPNIVQVYDFDFDPETNSYYMVMEFVDGPNLKAILRDQTNQNEVMPLEEAVRIVVAVASALHYAHQYGMVHRDVKPANIILTQKGQVILSDFGIARMVNTNTLTASGAMVGTPAYMAPEQGMGQAGDERSDIYSLGVVLYQLATNRLPFDADTPLGIVLKHINTPLTPPTAVHPAIPLNVETVMMRALAKSPDDRYATAQDFATDLERALAGESIALPKPTSSAGERLDATIISPNEQSASQEWTATAPPAGAALRSFPKWPFALGGAAALLILITLVLFTTGMTDRLAALLSPSTPTPTVVRPPTLTPTPDVEDTMAILSTQVAAGVDAALSTRDALATYQATINAPTVTPSPTATPDGTATARAACTFEMQLVSDRPVLPAILTPGQRFIKRWSVKNSGTCAWPTDTQLVFVSGDQTTVVTEPKIEPLRPGETTEIRLTLQAPASYAVYNSVWQLEYGEEIRLGEELNITFQVGQTPTVPPTETPTATPTPEVTTGPLYAPQITRYGMTYWRLDEDTQMWHANITIDAVGGDGTFTFYLDEINENNVFVNGSQLSAQKCRPLIGTFYVLSAGQVSKMQFWIPYPDATACE